uniref:Uncharacterized protein n=1 Tax=Babesia bovis TaxID=5865 RepID=S6BMX8_BABBO|nr:hypothetical protein [Babesia bovis]
MPISISVKQVECIFYFLFKIWVKDVLMYLVYYLLRHVCIRSKRICVFHFAYSLQYFNWLICGIRCKTTSIKTKCVW